MRLLTKAFTILALTVASSYADPIIYDFVGTGGAFPGFPAEPVGFQLVVTDFVDPPLNGPPLFVFFSCAQLESSTNCDIVAGSDAVSFSNQGIVGSSSAQLEFAATNGVFYAFFFPGGAFGSPGIYNTQEGSVNVGTLTVTVSTPEPSSAILFANACALALLISKARRNSITRHHLPNG